MVFVMTKDELRKVNPMPIYSLMLRDVDRQQDLNVIKNCKECFLVKSSDLYRIWPKRMHLVVVVVVLNKQNNVLSIYDVKHSSEISLRTHSSLNTIRTNDIPLANVGINDARTK
jgi:hypothetical protein